MSRITVLALDTPVPAHGGSRLRLLHLGRAIARRDDVTMFAVGDVPDQVDEPFELLSVPFGHDRVGALVRSVTAPYLSRRLHSADLADRVASTPADLVQSSSIYFMAAARRAGVPVVLDAHNVETDIVQTQATTDSSGLNRLRWRWETRTTRAFEVRELARADAVLACSDADAAWFEPHAREVVVVPNGVDVGGTPWRPPAEGTGLAYIGLYSYRPNEVAALELVDDILPRVRTACPDATATLIGANPTREMHERASEVVHVTGRVDDAIAHLQEARVLVISLKAGSGTRLKALEAMAAGVPVVSTTTGVAGLAVRDGEHVLIADGPRDLADAATRVLTDDALARRLSEQGRRLVEATYDWSVCAQPMLDLHDRILGRATP